MKRLASIVFPMVLITSSLHAQNNTKPCTLDTLYRQFDFWIGDWDVYGIKGAKAGESHIALMLDSCIIYENWQSTGRYAGKSFNTYNRAIQHWQQTWVDDKGGLTEYFGNFAGNKMTLVTKPFSFSKDTMAIRKMTFYNLSPATVRQHGEISKDGGKTWTTEFDLEYRRRK